MTPEEMGYTAGSGLFGSIFGGLAMLFGMKEKIEDTKKDLEELKKVVLYADTCVVCSANGDRTHQELRDDIKVIKTGQDETNKVLHELVGELRGKQK